MIHIPQIKKVQVRSEGTTVVLISNGMAILSLPWNAALELAKVIRIQAKKGEELAKAANIVADQALLMRSGFGLGLSARRDIMKEAAKEAAWNRDLRRAIPSIKSAEKFGVPSLIQHPPPENGNGRG